MKRKGGQYSKAQQTKKPVFRRQNAMPNLAFQKNTVRTNPAELKEITNAGFTTTLTAGASSWVAPAAGNLLNAVVQGTTAETRVGRKIRMRKIVINWSCDLQPTSVQGGLVRFVVLIDKQANAAFPTILNVFNTNDFHSPMNLANSDRFIILRNHITPPLSANGDYSQGGKMSIKLDQVTLYNDTNGGTIADIQTNAVYLLVCQNGNIATAGPTFTFISRVRFDDN